MKKKTGISTCAEEFPHNVSKAKVCMGSFAVLLHWHRYHCTTDESTHRCLRSGGREFFWRVSKGASSKEPQESFQMKL